MFPADITFANPGFFYALILLPILAVWYYFRHERQTSELRYSSLLPFAQIKPTLRERMRHAPFILRLIILGLLIVALARPQTTSQGENIYTEGIDIVLVLDISRSMLAEDFTPNRLEAAKQVAADFVSDRIHDRIGLVVFAGQGFTQCPMTLDYRVLKNLMSEVQTGVVEDGTAIGMGIAQGVNRLKDSKAKSKVMILLTDGENNRGEIDPITAAQIAKTFGIRIYAIGVGTIGVAPLPVPTPFGVRYQTVPVIVDEKTLQSIADITDGKFFRATNNKTLKQIYEEIDKLEKTRIEVRAYRSYTELFYDWVGWGLGLLLLEMMLSYYLVRKLP